MCYSGCISALLCTCIITCDQQKGQIGTDNESFVNSRKENDLIFLVKDKGKIVPVYAMKAYMGVKV
jgi:hypothetical protein